eukprot:TRINITY_DN95664_c0_g1_i1.p1 TRINITY_DN95664_c0_g1~~TRINITY_DN95664_c0_g1_i1.p1  ORF type:complete len:263 (+),score=57.46 TRINITY_DN95664_c0_g1_i1:45-833(+)
MGNTLWLHFCISRQTKDDFAKGLVHITHDSEILDLPNGAGCEAIADNIFGANTEQLINQCPEAVQQIISDTKTEDIYNDFMKAIINTHKTPSMAWDCEELKKTVEEFAPRFASRGVDIFMCMKAELYAYHLVSVGKEDLLLDNKWIVYIDRSKAPDYTPKYIWDGSFPGVDVVSWVKGSKVELNVWLLSGELLATVIAFEKWTVVDVRQALQDKLPPEKYVQSLCYGNENLLQQHGKKTLVELGLGGKVMLVATLCGAPDLQ